MRPDAAPEAGHRLVAHTADCIIEAWGPDLCSCLVEAMRALPEIFARVPAGVPTTRMAVTVQRGWAAVGAELLVALLEEEIYTVDALGMVPVNVRLDDVSAGGAVGEMEVVDAREVEQVGPVPKAISYHGLELHETGGAWRCRALVDV